MKEDSQQRLGGGLDKGFFPVRRRGEGRTVSSAFLMSMIVVVVLFGGEGELKLSKMGCERFARQNPFW